MNGLDDTLVRAVAKKAVDVSGMPPLERVIGFPSIGAGALAVIVSRFMPSLDLSADAGLYAALKGNTLLAHGRFDPTVIAMALSAKLGFVDKYSLLLDVHESMLYLTQITDAAADKVDFLIRGRSERVDWTLGVWVHTPRLSAAQRRQSNVSFTRRDLDAYHDALVCFAEDVEWQWSIGGAQLGVEGDGGGETHLTDAQELWKPAAVPELPQWADLSGDAVLFLKRQ